MTDASNTFKKAPKRKTEKARTVSMSPEMRQAYADLLTAKETKQETYGRHLPTTETKGR